MFCDRGLVLPAEWDPHLARLGARPTQQLHKASVFIAAHPWQPNDDLIAWVARLIGGWVLAPTVFMGAATGPALKLQPSLTTRRRMWVSDGFRAAFPRHWLSLLECLNSFRNNWALLASPQEFADLKARMIVKQRSAEVIGLICEADQQTNVPHVFVGPAALLAFIERRDDARTSVGLGNQ